MENPFSRDSLAILAALVRADVVRENKTQISVGRDFGLVDGIWDGIKNAWINGATHRVLKKTNCTVVSRS